MSRMKKTGRFPAFLLILTLAGTAFWWDVPVSRAEESLSETQGTEGTEEESVSSMDGEPDIVPETLAEVRDPGPEDGPDTEQEKGIAGTEADEDDGGLPEGSEEKPQDPAESLPEDSAEEMPEEAVPQLLKRPAGAYALQPAAAGSDTYPIYIIPPEITFLEKDEDAVRIGGANSMAKETAVGGTVTSQHRATLSIRCSKCYMAVYMLQPRFYADVTVTYSDPSIIGENGYGAGRWNLSSTAEGAGCLQIDTELLRPGRTSLETWYSIRFPSDYNPMKRCPECSERLYTSDSRWYRYRNGYEIRSYAEYTLRYDANAGDALVEDMPSAQTQKEYAESAELTISEKKPWRHGYDFIGWAESPDALVWEYLPEEEIRLDWTEGKTVEKTLYAVWKRVVPTVPTEPAVPEDPADEKPDLTFIKKACGTDTVTPVTSVEVGEAYSYVVTVRNNMEHAVEDLNVSEALDADLIQLLNIPPGYENEIWKIDRLEGQETAVLILHVKALAADPAYENTIRLMWAGPDGEEKEIPPGPDDQPTAVVEIRDVPDPPEEEPETPKEDPKDPKDPDDPDDPDPTPVPTPDPVPPVQPIDPVPPRPVPIPSVVRPPVPEAQTADPEPAAEQIAETAEKTAGRPDPSSGEPVKTADPRLPLAGRGRHLCCILHFVILLLAWFAEWLYMRSMKRHQKQIFELRRELEDPADENFKYEEEIV